MARKKRKPAEPTGPQPTPHPAADDPKAEVSGAPVVGKIELRQEPVELAALIQAAVETTRHHIAQRSQELSLSLPLQPIYLNADPIRLEQVFSNLLNNASKFTPSGGHIWLTVEEDKAVAEDPPEVVVRVRDDGIGIAPDALPHVFDLFMLDRSLDRVQGGLGIGLTLAQRLIELHGGRIEAHSAGPGQGSEFVVRLPIHAVAPRQARVKPARNALADTGAARRVLIVDDNVDGARTLATLLRLSGHEIQVAFDGPTALALAATFHPQVVLLDIGLPGMDGYEVARRLRQLPEMDQALLVAVTGYGQDEDRRLTAEAGFHQHLVKPVEVEELYQLLGHPPAK